MDNRSHSVLLIMADISGYTEFMLRTRTALEHSLVVITALLTELVESVELPLEVVKIEGDSVFICTVLNDGAPARDQSRTVPGERLMSFFDRFAAKVNSLVADHQCPCDACENIERLRLKIIVHAGEAGFHRIGRFEEIGGVDVIILHRLMKNTVPGEQYLLVTDAARDLFEFPTRIEFTEGEEICPGIGRIGTHVYLFD